MVFYIHSLSSGGAERVTVLLANYWAKLGREVVIITVTDESLDFYTLDDRIRRIALDLAVESRHFGQAVIYNLRRVLALRRVLLQVKPNVAVAMMTTANATLAVAGYFSGVPTVGSERVHPPAWPLGWMWETIRRWTYPLLSGLVAQTKESAAWLRTNASAKRIVVIPNPIVYPLIEHSPSLLPSKIIAQLGCERMLLSIGRLEKQKGHDRLLSAFGTISERHPSWSLVILGSGSLQNQLNKQIINMGISDKVALPGTAGNIGEWFKAADLFALTSRFEGFPNTLLEAMAYGVPSIAVDCETGPNEIIRHEIDGLLVPQDDHEALVVALDRLMTDKLLRLNYSERAVEVRERFAVTKIAKQWEQLFEECINE